MPEVGKSFFSDTTELARMPEVWEAFTLRRSGRIAKAGNVGVFFVLRQELWGSKSRKCESVFCFKAGIVGQQKPEN